MSSILSFSFFITKMMKVDLRAGELNGTLPILYVIEVSDLEHAIAVHDPLARRGLIEKHLGWRTLRFRHFNLHLFYHRPSAATRPGCS